MHTHLLRSLSLYDLSGIGTCITSQNQTIWDMHRTFDRGLFSRSGKTMQDSTIAKTDRVDAGGRLTCQRLLMVVR